MGKRYVRIMNKVAASLGLLFLLCGGIGAFAGTVAIRGGEIHTMTGKIITSGTILIQNGKIVAIGEDTEIPEGAEIIEADGSILYPGFFAASGFFTPRGLENFESFTPDASAADRFDYHGDYARYLKGGVTSGFVTMPANRIIPGKGMVVKLGSRDRMSQVLKKEGALCINLGKEALLPPMTDIFPAPVSVENPLVPSIKQFPSSVLGAYGLLNELFRPVPFTGDLAHYFQKVADSLQESQTRGLPLIVRCERAADVQRTILFSQSVNMPLIVQGAAGASRCIESLKKHNIPVIVEADLVPNGQRIISDLDYDDEDRSGMKDIAELIQQGILVAIAAKDDKGMPELFWITQYFRKFRIDPEVLLKTITINPAKMFGLEERLGSLEKGKDADILFFEKVAGASLPVLEKVMSQGCIVYEEK